MLCQVSITYFHPLTCCSSSYSLPFKFTFLWHTLVVHLFSFKDSKHFTGLALPCVDKHYEVFTASCLSSYEIIKSFKVCFASCMTRHQFTLHIITRHFLVLRRLHRLFCSPMSSFKSCWQSLSLLRKQRNLSSKESTKTPHVSRNT